MPIEKKSQLIYNIVIIIIFLRNKLFILMEVVMKNHIRKPLSVILSLLTLFSCLPTLSSAYADETAYQYILGDINSDGQVTLKDASVIQRVDVGLEFIAESQYRIGDVNGDGNCSLADAYLIQKYVLETVMDYPVNQNGYRIGDSVPFPEDSDTDSEINDTDTQDTDSEVTDTSSDDTDSTITETDTDTFTEDTDSTVTETDTDTSTEDTDSTITETDTSTEETDSDDTDSEEPVVLVPLEEINAKLNGDFENGDVTPDRWEMIWNGMSGTTASGEGVNGSKALKFSHGYNTMSFVVQRVDGLIPGADYKFRVKVKGSDIVTNTVDNGLSVDVGTCLNGRYLAARHEDGTLDQGKGYMMYATENWLKGTFDWKEITCYFVADHYGRADIVLYLHGQGTGWYDDLVIEKADFDSEVTTVRRFVGEHTGIIVYQSDIDGLNEDDIRAWVADFDLAYEQMTDLMGCKPFYGDKCYYVSSVEPDVTQFEALGTINPIKWSRRHMSEHCKNWCTEHYQTAVGYHEMGHNFDTMYPWSPAPENTADFKAAYVIMNRNEGKVNPVSYYGPVDVKDYMTYLKSLGGTCYDNTFAKRRSYTNVNYYDSVPYLMVRTCEAVGWDTVKDVYRSYIDNYDTSYAMAYSKFMYWIMSLQNMYNKNHPDATGYEVYDSFPEGEIDYFKEIYINWAGGYANKDDKDVHCVQFLDPDGNRLWFEFVPHGAAASPKDIPAHEKYGAFTGWDQDLSCVMSDMTVTANYEKYHTAGTVKASQSSIYEGEFVEFTVDPDISNNYICNIIAMRNGTKVFESGYTDSRSAKLFIDSAGKYTVYAQLKDPQGNEYSTSKLYFTAGRAVTIYYSGFNNPNIHYKNDTGSWTKVPGKQMDSNSDVSGYSYKYVIPINKEGGSAEICFNDGNNNWDNNGEQNYKVSEGAYGIKNGTVTQIT